MRRCGLQIGLLAASKIEQYSVSSAAERSSTGKPAVKTVKS
jgi:hypothetical protein